MKLTYIYHSCFVLQSDTFAIILDYYKDSSVLSFNGYVHRLLSDFTGRLYVLSTHSHADHFNPEILNWRLDRPDIQYVFSSDIQEKCPVGVKNIVFLDKLGIYQDDLLCVNAFGSTDIGLSFRIKVEGKTLFHAGDLNNWHWNEESTPYEVQDAETNYLAELELLAHETQHIDLAMFPIDPRLGKDYMRGAEQFIDRIETSLLVPMHFDEAYHQAAAFEMYARARGCAFVAWSFKGESIEF